MMSRSPLLCLCAAALLFVPACDGNGSTSSGPGGAGGSAGSAGSAGAAGAGGAAGSSTTGGGGSGAAAGAGGCSATPVETVKCSDATDLPGQWTGYVEDGAASEISVLPGGVHGGYLSADTKTGFLYRLRFVPDAKIDASGASALQVAVKGLNKNPNGWQINSPVLVVEDVSGAQKVYSPASNLLPADGVTWRLVSAPLAGGPGWDVSGPDVDLSQVAAIEIRTDTWDTGFVLSVDALSFKKAGEVCEVSCPDNCSGRGQCDPVSLGCSCDVGATGANCGACAEGFMDKGGSCALVNDGTFAEWPNAVSSANSDPWLAVHHDEIEVLKPRLLVLHFVNKSDPATSTIVKDVIAGFEDGSRYHGYVHAGAAPQLEYQIDKVVDLRDGVDGRPPAPSGYMYDNSTLYPRKDMGGNLVMDYGAFFGPEFAALYKYPDPKNPGQFLDLCSLVDQGLIHEVWMVASGDVPDAPAAEVLESKQRYSAKGTKLAGQFERCAGNGCFDVSVPVCDRSVRIGFVNYNRGPGCYMHSHGHGMESAAAHGVVPGLSEWFFPFAAFDLDVKYGLPFGNLYAMPCASPPCAAYPEKDRAVFTTDAGKFDISPYDGVCGNVHFPPNGAAHYDYAPAAPVLSSCAGFGENGVMCGVDQAAEVSKDVWAGYEAAHGDCGGGFLTWWYQSMPAFGAEKSFKDGRRMKSAWPYLFY